MKAITNLPNQRIHSLDLFRGITILLMIFVNEVAGMRQIPQWLKHMPSGADGMTITDWVFPGFIFIVGMSIPLAINHRIHQGDDGWQLIKHILIRTLGLLVLGVFMVNAEGGNYHQDSMIIPIALWSLIFYPAVILIWNQYRNKSPLTVNILRISGVIMLVFLAVIYRGGDDGSTYLQPHWWGILGLIGWAYFYGCMGYLLLKGNKYWLFAGLIFCTAVYVVGHSPLSADSHWLQWTRSKGGLATDTGIAISGMILTIILFDQNTVKTLRNRIFESLGFALFLFALGAILRPYFSLAKLGATPSWGLYSAGFGILGFLILYWITDLKQINRWANFFRPAGSNPLLTYIIPFIMWALYSLFDFYPLPDEYRYGIIGVIYALLYAVLILLLVKLLNKINIKLQL